MTVVNWSFFALIACLVIVGKYEYSLVNQCTVRELRQHEDNLFRVAHLACNEDYRYFAGVLQCQEFEIRLNPELRRAQRWQCWWENHIFLNSYITWVLVAAFTTFAIRYKIWRPTTTEHHHRHHEKKH